MQKESNLFYESNFVDPPHKIYTKLLKIVLGNTFKLILQKLQNTLKVPLQKINILFISQKFSTKYEDKNKNYDFVKVFLCEIKRQFENN